MARGFTWSCFLTTFAKASGLSCCKMEDVAELFELLPGVLLKLYLHMYYSQFGGNGSSFWQLKCRQWQNIFHIIPRTLVRRCHHFLGLWCVRSVGLVLDGCSLAQWLHRSAISSKRRCLERGARQWVGEERCWCDQATGESLHSSVHLMIDRGSFSTTMCGAKVFVVRVWDVSAWSIWYITSTRDIEAVFILVFIKVLFIPDKTRVLSKQLVEMVG